MKKKRVLKITPVLITLNLLVLFAIGGFYLSRLIKYYKIENGETPEDTPIILVDEIKKKRSYLDDTKGLVLDEKTGKYIYKGEVDDNYIYYSGLYYRIMEVDENNNIKAISEENVTLMYPGFKNGYEESHINKWLNKSDKQYSGVFEDTLEMTEKFLVGTSFCSDSITDMENITCEEKNSDNKITLLSLYDYKLAGGKSSYLNNKTTFNLGTLNDENLSYYVNEEGDIALQQKDNRAIYVRPVLTFNADTVLLKGNGKKPTPYRIELKPIKSLADAYVGNYLKLNGENYRVVKKLEDKVLVVKSEIIKQDETPIVVNFGGSNNIYTLGAGIGKYLNNTYLNTLELKDSVVTGEFYNGLLEVGNYDYALLKSSKVNAKVAMLTMGDMFINETNSVLTMLRGIEADNIVYSIDEDGNYFGDVLSAKYNVCPALYLKNDLLVNSGVGIVESPFEIGVNDEEGQ